MPRGRKKSAETSSAPEVSSSDPLASVWCQIKNEVNKAAKGDFVSVWDDKALSEPAFRVSTGSNLLDMALGGGLPSGRFVELFGWQGVGKSTICSHLGSSAQLQKGFFVKLDAEVSSDKTRDAKLGIIPDRYFYVRVDSVEKGFDLIHKITDSVRSYPAKLREAAKEMSKEDAALTLAKAQESEHVPLVIAWDSIAATPVESEVYEEEDGKEEKKGGGTSGMASKARSIREELRKLTTYVADNNILVVFVNHLIETIQKGGYGPKSITTCGHAIDFWASVQIKLTKKGQFVIGTNNLGIYVQADVVKSKLSPPLYQVQFPLTYDHGIDRYYEAFDYLYAAKKIEQRGAYYYINDYPEEGKQTSIRYGDLHSRIADDPKLWEFLATRMKALFFGL